jgi:alanyl-tRNA synthetase
LKEILENLDRDQDAYDFWKAHISEDRIINGNKKDNFWEMGEADLVDLVLKSMLT